MKTSVFRTELPYSTESVWAVMTDTTQYAWRSDLKCIETDSDTVFREIYPNGNETVFTITEKKPFTRYAFMAWNLNKLQQTYVQDLKKELVRRNNCKEASASL